MRDKNRKEECASHPVMITEVSWCNESLFTLQADIKKEGVSLCAVKDFTERLGRMTVAAVSDRLLGKTETLHYHWLRLQPRHSSI